MRYVMIVGLALAACRAGEPAERYGFIARLGRDTVSVESVTRRGNRVTSDEVDRFPRVRRRHTEIELAPDGGIRRLVMDIVTPSESANLRQRRVTVTVTKDSVHITKRDSTTVRRDFATGGSIAMAHLPQMYSLYELYFAAALGRMAATPAAGDTAHLRQFYIDREFDRFPLHTGRVWRMPDGKLNISHDWLAGIGEATVDSTGQLVSYSGLRTTYKVDVTRVAEPPDVQAIGERFAAAETTTGGFRQLSVRDTARATIGAATFAVDYGRPLARGRELLGKLLPYDYVWRTGANAATQFTTSAPITLAGIRVPAGTYTLWTVPRVKRADLIVNKQTGQWGTGYDSSKDLGMGAMTLDSLETPVEQFTISITGSDARHGTLTMEWGQFRWTAPIILLDSAARH